MKNQRFLGSEAVLTVVAAGEQVSSVQVGTSYLVQADWRDLKTDNSNGAFGYNFEGGLQQYVLLDERTTVSADGTEVHMEVQEGRGFSATSLVEPWACVETLLSIRSVSHSCLVVRCLWSVVMEQKLMQRTVILGKLLVVRCI